MNVLLFFVRFADCHLLYWILLIEKYMNPSVYVVVGFIFSTCNILHPIKETTPPVTVSPKDIITITGKGQGSAGIPWMLQWKKMGL